MNAFNIPSIFELVKSATDSSSKLNFNSGLIASKISTFLATNNSLKAFFT